MTVETATKILEDLSLSDEKTTSAAAKTDPQSPKFAKRRRPWSPRTIPRDNLSGKESPRKRSQRRRTDSETSRQHRRNPRHRTTSEVSTMSESPKDAPPMKILKDTVTERFEKKGRTLLDSYLKNCREMVNFECKTKFLQRCKAYEVVPMPYRLTNFNIKNTKVIRRILDKFSLQLMFADLNYCRKRCEQIKKLLAERTMIMMDTFGEKLASEIIKVSEENSERRSQQLKDRHSESFKSLVEEYKLSEEDLQAGAERLNIFEQLDKERHERRIQKQQEKEQKGEGKPETEVEAEPEEVKKTQE